jgi:UDP-GlcNAc:undecaprenyl-phosphate GlcNAc-1-phosphate transferase
VTRVFAFLLAAAGGVACTWVVRGLALRWGIVNQPNPLVAQHTRPVAYLGGLGLAGGVAIGVGTAAALWPEMDLLPGGIPADALATGALLFLGIGLVDDLRAFSPLPKLLLQFAAAAIAAAAGVLGPRTGVAAADVAIAAFWMVVLVNAVNFTDVCDGLVSSIALVAFGILGLAEPRLGAGPLLVAGAALGVLAFNRPPASIFLGDAGSHLLGFLLAAGTLAGAAGRPPWPALPWALLAGGVFLFELAFITAERVRKGLPWWRGSPDHFALRLQAAGVGRGGVDAGAALAAALLAGSGAALWRLEARMGIALLAGLAVGLAVAWRVLARLPAPVRRPASPATAGAVAEAGPRAGA